MLCASRLKRVPVYRFQLFCRLDLPLKLVNALVQPVAQSFFGLSLRGSTVKGINAYASWCKFNKSAWDLFAAKPRRDELYQPAILAEMRSSPVKEVRTARRFFKDVRRAPRPTK